jgi:hypothetical protein
MLEKTLIRIFLFLLIIAVIFFALRAFLKASPAVLSKYIKIVSTCLIGVAVAYLAATGHLNWLFALVSLAIAFIMRLMPVLLHYAPRLYRLWLELVSAKQSTSYRQDRSAVNGRMSRREAFEVLGLKQDATEQEIIAAHRKLIQKIHPDRGGSDYLASKINLAKKILLKK